MQPEKFEWDPRESPPYLLGRAARLFSKRADERLKRLGFANAHVPVLRALKDGDARSQTALAVLANIEQPTMAQMLARMERDKLVRRTPNPEDGRSFLYSLTAKALAKVSAAHDVLVLGGTEILAGLSAKEVDQLGGLLKRMIANIEEPEV